MKALKIAAMLLLTAGFVQAQDVVVKGNTKVNTDFSKYKTFAWAQMDETAQPESGYYIYTYTEQKALPPATKTTRTTKAGSKTTTTTTTTVTAPYVYSYNVIIPSTNLIDRKSVV